jgi:hypothetical protein
MTGWLDRVDDLLYDGETVVERVAVDDGGVVVTTHRVLSFTPERDGANFRYVDRPNVTGVSASASGEFGFLQQALKAIVVGVVLLIAGQTVSFDSLVAGVTIDSSAAQVGMGGMLGMLSSFLQLMAQLDELMTMFGALAVILAMVIFAVYLLTRDRVLVIAVAGGDDILVPAPKETAEAAAVELESALFEGGAAPESDPLDAEPADAGFKSDDPL